MPRRACEVEGLLFLGYLLQELAMVAPLKPSYDGNAGRVRQFDEKVSICVRLRNEQRFSSGKVSICVRLRNEQQFSSELRGDPTQEMTQQPEGSQDGWRAHFDLVTVKIQQSDRWRTIKVFDTWEHRTDSPAKSLISFASNDYLGLSHHPNTIKRSQHALERFGTGSGSSRLIAGTRSLHQELEEALAQWKKTEKCLVFSSGYCANIGVLTSLLDSTTEVFSDELNHASIIDGIRLSKAPTTKIRHLDLVHLEECLSRSSAKRKAVVTDAIFSMDGDQIDFEHILSICRRYNALLIVDEAHDVFEQIGHAQVESQDLLIRVGTLSKTLGSQGGFVCASAKIIDLLINRARSFIFTTALAPSNVGAALGSLEVLRSEQGAQLKSNLKNSIRKFGKDYETPIIPIQIGLESRALQISKQLLDLGYLIPAIRPPTVPQGTSRLRLSLSSDHSAKDVDSLIEALRDLGVLA